VPAVAIYVDSAKLQKALKEVGPEMVAELKEGNKALGEIVGEACPATCSGAFRCVAEDDQGGEGGRRCESQRRNAGLSSKVPYAGPIHFGWARSDIEPEPVPVRRPR
jgi:hypothetical protein